MEGEIDAGSSAIAAGPPPPPGAHAAPLRRRYLPFLMMNVLTFFLGGLPWTLLLGPFDPVVCLVFPGFFPAFLLGGPAWVVAVVAGYILGIAIASWPLAQSRIRSV